MERALPKDPLIFVLDEAASSLDTEPEELMQTAVERLMRGRTTLAIAHRLSTVVRADRITMLWASRIAEAAPTPNSSL